MNEKDALDVETSAFYLAEILAGVFFLHDRQIIHRDLKPENLLLGQSEHGIHIKICDFATAKVLRFTFFQAYKMKLEIT